MTESAAGPYAIRPVNPEEWDAVVANDELVFGDLFPEEVLERERQLLDWSRTLAAYDGDDLIGFTAAYDLALTVPGAVLPHTGGVTWVGVRSTHRRRGVLRSLMHRQLTDLHELGEPVATLWASEGAIYGRFGYGLASMKYSLTLPRRAGLTDAPRDPSLRLRIVDPKKSFDALEAVAATAPSRPGFLARTEPRWNRSTDSPTASRGGGRLYCLVAESGGQPRGYALYVPKGKWEDAGPAGTVIVREVLAADQAAYAELWRFLLDIDLMTTIEYWNLPVDDPLLLWLADPRRAKPTLSDSMFVRILDIGAALSARRYATDVDVVIDVSDDVLAWNGGHWRLTADSSGVSCTKTQEPADLSLDARSLGSAYLGGVPLETLAAAGRVAEHTPGTVATTSRAFTSPLAPWCPFIF
jgi:predicted acetyltransferase